MSALADLVSYLKAKDASKEAREKKAARKAEREKAAGRVAPDNTNPNVDRFKQSLVDSGAKSSEGSGTTLVEQRGESYPEKPAEWKAAEAIHGPHLFLGRSLRAMAYAKKFSYAAGPTAVAKVTRDI